MYCHNCGARIPDDSIFCTRCGAKTTVSTQASTTCPPYQPYMAIPMKSEVLSIILALLIPGTGHLYIGKLVQGLIILIAYFSLYVLSMVWLLPIMISIDDPAAYLYDAGTLTALVLVSIIAFIIWIVQLIDVYNQTKKYNDVLRQTGQPPW
ncbi:MAG: zinc ribbon domain-containing protein [Euryarchaeota archaeon]|nr:zinc ribbon domain-containing protein [Euryarchaeota archaeon]